MTLAALNTLLQATLVFVAAWLAVGATREHRAAWLAAQPVDDVMTNGANGDLANPHRVILRWGLAMSAFSMSFGFVAQFFAEAVGAPVAPPEIVAHANRRQQQSMLPAFLANHINAAFLYVCLIYYYVWTVPFDAAAEFRSLPSSLVETTVLVLLYDLQSYVLHWSGHRFRFLWVHMHGMHHEFSLPNSPMSGIYGDSWESFMVAVFAFWMPVVWHVSYVSFVAFPVIIAFLVQLNHSGRRIDVPYVFSTKFHLAHHTRRTVNFAEHTALWDWLFGTMYMPATYEELYRALDEQ